MNPYKKLAEKKDQPRLSVRPRTHLKSKQEETLYDSEGQFNPQRYEVKSSSRGTAKRTDRRMFDKSGQVNAQDKGDALRQIYHLLSNVTKENKDLVRFEAAKRAGIEDRISNENKRQILAAALNDPSGQGFRVVGQELALPIKAIMDYEGFARKMFNVKSLGQAELFRIPVDVRSVAYVIGQDGQTPEARIKTKYITPNEQKITSFPTIDLLDILHMNFDVLDRIQDTARQEIELQEDKLALNLIDRASTTVNTVTTFGTLGINAFEDVRYQVEQHRLIVENFWINRAELSDIVKTMSTAVDMATEREIILAGYIGTIFGAQILTAAGTGVEQVIPAGTFYATVGKDYLGVMGERKSLESETFNKLAMGETVKGWGFVEVVGFGMPDGRRVAKGVK